MKWELLWIPVIGMLMGAGLVQTRDGKTIEGEILLDDGTLIVRPAAGGQESRILLADIRNATFRAETLVDRPVGGAAGALPDGWKSQDIGPVHRKGSAVCDDKGMFTINASGWGAWGPDDTIHYVYRSLEGDGQIIAHLAKVDDSRGRMAAGVMIRQELSPDAPMAGTIIHPSGEVRLSRRMLRDAPDFKKAEEISPRSWVRLTRRGDVFSVYSSTNGKHWELVESRKIEMSPKALVGLSAGTLTNTSLGTAQMDSVLVIPGTPAANWFPGGDGLQQGIVMCDGTAMAGIVQTSDENGLGLMRKGREDRIPWKQAARIVFNLASPDLKIDAKKGLWMNNGDFLEGEVTEVAMRPVKPESRDIRLYVKVKSVLFGTRQFDAVREVMVAVLADVTPAATTFQLRTADGSVYRSNTVEIRKGGIVVDGVELADVVQIARQ